MVGDVVSWNVFRLAGDFLHLGGMVLGLLAVWGESSVDGFSRKTQLLYQTVYVCRYLDVFTEKQSSYLLFFKCTFNLLTAAMLAAFSQFQYSYDSRADSCNLLAVLIPTSVATFLVASGSGFREEMWTFSEFLEPFALVPQYIVCYKASRIRRSAVLYVLAVGGYRVLYVLNWIYKRLKWHARYRDYTSWLGGAVECILFVDFIIRITHRRDVIGEMGGSALGRLLLQADDTAGRLSEKIELGVIGQRLPFGLSGPGSQDDERKRREWDVSDKLVEDEGCNLLTLSGDAAY